MSRSSKSVNINPSSGITKNSQLLYLRYPLYFIVSVIGGYCTTISLINRKIEKNKILSQTSKSKPGIFMSIYNSISWCHFISEELCYAKSMPEGLNKQTESDVIDLASQSPRGSVTAQSVPDLLIHPGQESSYQSSSPKMERQMKPSISLTRVMSMKATLMKNAIMSGWKRRGIVFAAIL